jgi:hypothetical protein
MVVIFSVERVKAIYRPYYHLDQSGYWKLYIQILILFCTFSVTNLLVYYTSFVFKSNQFYSSNHLDFFVSHVITLAVNYLIPIVIIIAANVLVVIKMRKNLKELRYNIHRSLSSQNSAAHSINTRINSQNGVSRFSNEISDVQKSSSPSYRMIKKRERELKRTAFTLFAVSFEFFLFNIPTRASIIVVNLLCRKGCRKSFPIDIDFFTRISNCLIIANYSLNFFLYLIHISSFRNEFFNLVARCLKCLKSWILYFIGF